MRKRLIAGLIVIFLILTVQDRFFNSEVNSKKIIEAPIYRGRSSVAQSELPFVTRIVDGDTIVVLVGGGVSEKVRLIGVDTPETVDPRKPVQCFGKEASAFARSLLENKTVRLEADASQGDRDKYGRLLRYVYQGVTLVNIAIIREGYGHEYTYRLPYKYQAEFKNAERTARDAQKGLWAQGACGLKNAGT